MSETPPNKGAAGNSRCPFQLRLIYEFVRHIFISTSRSAAVPELWTIAQTMRRWVFIVILLLTASAARANPVPVGPLDARLGSPIVAVAALVVETGVVVLLLLPRGVAPLPTFGGYLVTNVVVFILLVYALLFIPIPLFELLAVTADAACIKLLCGFREVQGENFRGVSWGRAALISFVGNCVSFLVGLAAQLMF